MRKRTQAGAATAEAAVVIPVITLFCVGLSWLVGLGVAQVRAVDAAREVARAVARGDSEGASLALGRRVAPESSRFTVHRGGSTTTVRVLVPVSGPGGLFGFLPTHHVSAEAVAVTER